MDIQLPDEVHFIIDSLGAAGFDAYAVGGCVRDSVLRLRPKDWDICTLALPEQVMRCFDGRHIIETGLLHGTVTLILGHKPYEITSYRADGAYSDNRRPDKVEFIGSLKADLARRDFTINAMAYSPAEGFVDLCGGMADLNAKLIRCVGPADMRFGEDALRIMRALRFASELGFHIEESTSASLLKNKGLLQNIAAERIRSELDLTITGKGVYDVLNDYFPVISEIIPELIPTAGDVQNNPRSGFDVLQHTLKSVALAPKEVVLRLSMLLHDIAMPACCNETGSKGHFHSHAERGAQMARGILKRLKYDGATVKSVAELVLYHDAELTPEAKQVRRWLNRLGEAGLWRLVEVKRADISAQADEYKMEGLASLDKTAALIDEIIERRQCFSLAELAVDGGDLIAAGIPEGREIGIALNRLLDMVLDEQVDNDRLELLNAVREWSGGGLRNIL